MSSHGDNLDRLSSLPEELIPNILSLMPTKFAVQTCVLSKRWRYSWMFVHNLDLNCDDFYCVKRFSEFVDQALVLFKPFQVKKIRLHVSRLSNIPTSFVLKWMRKAVTFNVCELDIKVTGVELPLSLFNCKTLTKFRLRYSYPHFSLPDCVSSINLPNLITLDIDVDSEPFYDAVKLSHCCPMLVNLSLKMIWWDDKEDCTFNILTLKRLKLSIFSSSLIVKKVILNVPNLECLTVDGVSCSRFVIEDLSSLIEANVSWELVHEYLWLELLKVISEAKFLSLTTDCWMSFNGQSEWPTFPNLKRLELQGCAKAGQSWQIIPQFLERCSELEYFSVEKPNAGIWVEGLSIPTCMPMKLKTVRYSNTKGDMDDMQFIRFILSNSKALKTLTVECDATLSSKAQKQWFAELSSLDRGSRDCQIHFVGRLSLKNK